VDGEQVGELRSAPRRHFSSPQETAFSRQQWLTSGLIGVASLILTVIVALLLTRILLAPIRRAISGISRLSNGDYSSRLHEHRKDELGQLMNDLDRLAHKLEGNRASRQRWLADISHELRTPVTILTGEIETIKDGIRPLDMQQVLSLDQEVTRLRRLIEDLYELSVSDIGGLRYSFGPVDIRQSVTTAVEPIRMRANEQDIELKVVGEINDMVSADIQRMDQLFVNLLENSLAYTDAPGRIELSLSSTKDKIVIKIQDTPPGVDEEECEKLFEPLYRHEISRSRRTAGAGLGLAICRNIVDAHQGTITASPSELGGLCIQLVFPISQVK
jgi:two-component system sensor histidine kinase BaeS